MGENLKLCEGTVKSQRGDHAAFGPIVQIDIAVMQARDFTNERQPKAAALMAVFARQRIESLKDSFRGIVRNTAPVVDNAQLHLFISLSPQPGAISPPWGKVNRVVEQITQRLGQQLAIAIDQHPTLPPAQGDSFRRQSDVALLRQPLV